MHGGKFGGWRRGIIIITAAAGHKRTRQGMESYGKHEASHRLLKQEEQVFFYILPCYVFFSRKLYFTLAIFN